MERGPDRSGAPLERSLDQQRRGKGLLTRLDLDISFDIFGSSIASILGSAVEALRVSEQDRLFNLLCLKLDRFDPHSEVFGSSDLQALHVLSDGPQRTDNMVLPNNNVAHDALDIVTIECNTPRAHPATKKQDVDVGSYCLLQSQALFGNNGSAVYRE